jgi:hypothetical protein
MASNPEKSTSVGTVFGSIDLVQEILLNLTDDPTNLSMITGVSKSFQAAALDSSQVWRDACRLRWSNKWGFAERWKRAERESQSSGRWWRERYLWEEMDSKRDSINAQELCRFVWDMRFWLTDFWGYQENVLRPGLRRTASSEFQFGPPPSQIIGVWNDSWASQWTFRIGVVSCWRWKRPKAEICRLENWGWEIRNPTVCLRAIDARTNHNMYSMWDDYLQSVSHHRVQVWPGMEEGDVIIEGLTQFWGFLQNWLCFPWAGVQESVIWVLVISIFETGTDQSEETVDAKGWCLWCENSIGYYQSDHATTSLDWSKYGAGGVTS